MRLSGMRRYVKIKGHFIIIIHSHKTVSSLLFCVTSDTSIVQYGEGDEDVVHDDQNVQENVEGRVPHSGAV